MKIEKESKTCPTCGRAMANGQCVFCATRSQRKSAQPSQAQKNRKAATGQSQRENPRPKGQQPASQTRNGETQRQVPGKKISKGNAPVPGKTHQNKGGTRKACNKCGEPVYSGQKKCESCGADARPIYKRPVTMISIVGLAVLLGFAVYTYTPIKNVFTPPPPELTETERLQKEAEAMITIPPIERPQDETIIEEEAGKAFKTKDFEITVKQPGSKYFYEAPETPESENIPSVEGDMIDISISIKNISDMDQSVDSVFLSYYTPDGYYTTDWIESEEHMREMETDSSTRFQDRMLGIGQTKEITARLSYDGAGTYTVEFSDIVNDTKYRIPLQVS